MYINREYYLNEQKRLTFYVTKQTTNRHGKIIATLNIMPTQTIIESSASHFSKSLIKIDCLKRSK